MAEILDISDGGILRETNNGIEVDRIAVVTGVAGPPDQYLKNALDTAGLPAIGDANPMYSGLKCRSREATDDGCGNVRITLVYGSTSNRATFEKQVPPAGNSGTAVKNVGFTLNQIQTTTARNTTTDAIEEINVEAPTAFPAVNRFEQRPTIGVLIPTGRIVFERLELDPPLARFRECIGKVNSVAHGPYGAQTLLCSNIQARTANDGDWYQCTYEFSYDPLLFAGFLEERGAWQVQVKWKYPESAGGTAPPAEFGKSVKLYRYYEETDFETELALDFSD